VILLIFVEDWDIVASLALESVFSFPRIPTCDETHMNEIILFVVDSIPWSAQVHSQGKNLKLM